MASLAKLQLTEQEIVKYQKELSSVLEYVELLNEVDITGLEPTLQVTGLESVFRADVVIDYDAKKEDLLKLAPRVNGDYLEVNRMI